MMTASVTTMSVPSQRVAIVRLMASKRCWASGVTPLPRRASSPLRLVMFAPRRVCKASTFRVSVVGRFRVWVCAGDGGARRETEWMAAMLTIFRGVLLPLSLLAAEEGALRMRRSLEGLADAMSPSSPLMAGMELVRRIL